MEPLRGRADELSRLEALVTSTRQGAGGVAVVEGAAGIGKSRLLAEASSEAAAAGLIVAAGGADELDQASAWRVLLQALGSSTPAVLSSSELGSLGGLYDQRFAMVDRLQAVLERASTSRPLLVVLDDLQWADPASLLAVGLLARSLFSYPVGWVLALRPVPVKRDLDALVGRLVEGGATRLHLGPLGPEASVALARDAGRTGTDEDVARQVAAADGNPFYILALLKADRGTQRSGLQGAVTGAAGSAAQEAVAQHLRSLSDDVRRLLQVASVLGREFSVAEVASMMGQPASRLLGAVEEALRAEVIKEARDGLAFRHDLLRQAVYEALPASARPALHREAAQALRATGASAVRVAGQLAIGAAPGDAEALAAMLQAVKELGPSSPNAAADLALRMLELAGDRRERAAMVLAAVDVLGRAGRLTEARAVAERYLAIHRPPGPVEADLHFQLRQIWVIDRHDPYPTPVPPHVFADPAVGAGLVAALTALDRVPNGMLWSNDNDDGLDDAMRTVAASGRPLEFAAVAVLLVRRSFSRGYFEQALESARAAWADAQRLEGGDVSGVLEEMVISALTANGRLQEALMMMHSALDGARETGRTALLFRYRRLRAAVLVSQGSLDDAEAEARGVIDLPAVLGYPHRVALPLAVIVESALRRGNTAEARSMFARYGLFSGNEEFFRDGAGQLGYFPDLEWAAALLAEARGNAADAARVVAPIGAHLGAGYFVALTMHHRLAQMVRIALSAGAESEARQLAAMIASLAVRNPHVESLAAAGLHAQALVEREPALLEQAVELAARSEDRLLETTAREDLAHRLVEMSLPARAIEQLEAAYGFYVRTGAQRDTARVRAALRAIGVHKRQTSVARPGHGWASLSRSELAVVDLVARGMTNRAVANELFVSPDTVNTHLRHAFTKLGIRSRVELARLAAQRDQAPSQATSGEPRHPKNHMSG